MSTLLFVLVALGVLGVGVWGIARAGRRSPRGGRRDPHSAAVWRRVARRLEAPLSRSSSGLALIEGCWRGRRYALEALPSDDPLIRGGARLRIAVPELPGAFVLRCRPQRRDVRRPGLARRSEVQTGDTFFDEDVYLSGPAPLLRALLDHETRETLRLLSETYDVTIAGRRLTIELPQGAGTARHLFELLRAGADLADRFSLATKEELRERLLRSALHDPVTGVRCRCLHHLGELYGEEDRRALGRLVVDDDEPALRLAGARLLGPDALPHLEALLLCGDEDVEIKALRELEHLMDRPRFEALLADLLRVTYETGRLGLFTRVAQTLSRLPADRGRPALLDLIDEASPPWPEAFPVALRCLAGLPGTDTEKVLCDLLASAPPPGDVALALVETLGAVGGVRALRLLAERCAVLPVDLRPAALRALDEIRDRLGDDFRGGLAMAEPAREGRLALPATEGGDLTLDEPQRRGSGLDSEATEQPGQGRLDSR